ncbi:MAG: hypothetical protein ABFS56_01185 [Pseudomonadota bacterium]
MGFGAFTLGGFDFIVGMQARTSKYQLLTGFSSDGGIISQKITPRRAEISDHQYFQVGG